MSNKTSCSVAHFSTNGSRTIYFINQLYVQNRFMVMPTFVMDLGCILDLVANRSCVVILDDIMNVQRHLLLLFKLNKKDSPIGLIKSRTIKINKSLIKNTIQFISLSLFVNLF